MSKETRQLLRQLRKFGVPMKYGRKHVVVTGPCGCVWMPRTPSDHRSVRNTVAQLRRAGVPV